MTTASELFHNRRSRLGRNTIELGLDSSLDRISHHHPNHNNRRHLHHYNHSNRHDRHDLDGCDPPRRSPHVRNPINRLSREEREPVQPDQIGSQSASGHMINSEDFRNIRSRQRSNGNHRLPGAVLLARERLLERLRGVSVSGNRQSSRTPSGIHHNNFTFRRGYIESEEDQTIIIRDWPTETPPLTDFNSQTDGWLALQETRKRPPGLTQEALDCLHVEVFNNVEKSDEGIMSSASRDCSICLESFQEGDELIRLPCSHGFHSCCLDPWVRTCGDCPNCRTGIVVTGYESIE